MTRPALGIDLGTTYSCVAALDRDHRVTVLANQLSELTTPSVVFFEGNGNATVGKYAKNELKSQPDRVVSLIKRHMGEEGYTVEIDGQQHYPQRVSSVILRQIVEDALVALGVEPSGPGPLADVVITVPAYFGAAERRATKDAGEMAGLNVVSIINEPTAAAIAYGLRSIGSDRSVLVYDLGGGTFDVTIIRVSESEIRVVATGGDHQLGGADWDARMVDLIAAKFREKSPDAPDLTQDLDAAGSLELLAEESKKALSRRETYTDTVTANGERVKFEITRAEFEDATADLLGRTVGFTRDVLRVAADKGVERIDDVLLVGGMSHSPAVKRRLAEEFPDLPTPQLADPDQIVAKGAALFAVSSLAEGRDDGGSASRGLPGGATLPRIIDVTSKGYGIAVVRDPKRPDGEQIVAWVIRPNDEIPASPTETFRTVEHGQTSVDITVFESTTDVLSDEPADNLEMVSGTLHGLPAGLPAGQPIDVSLELGSDGILDITAVANNGVELKLQAKISGLIPDEAKHAPLPVLQR